MSVIDSDISEYLRDLTGRVENLEKLLRLFIKHTNSLSGALFVRENNSNKHLCIEYMTTLTSVRDMEIVRFEPLGPPEHVLVNSSFYTTPWSATTNMVLPVIVYSNYIGCVCVDGAESYATAVDDKGALIDHHLHPLLAVTQLILGKHKIANDSRIADTRDDTACQDMFLANISHEIRTPLNGIIGYNQLLYQSDLTTTQRSYLNAMNQCSLQLMQIINDVLDFSKLSSGKMVVNNDCFALHEIIECVSDMIKQRFIEKRQIIQFTVESSSTSAMSANNPSPAYFITDKQKIIQIIMNLVHNAHKFSDIGSVTTVRFQPRETDHFLVISVQDNGIGISEQDQYKVFNAFEQAQSTKCKSGTGLGLSICRKLCQLLGGSISVRSTLGVGSTFTFQIPYKPYEEFERTMEKDSAILRDKVVLAVDDNADNRIILSEILFGWKMHPVMCSTALEALRLVAGKRYKFAVGLIDICMPDMSGTELAKHIKLEVPFLPLIALSSLDSYIATTDFDCKLEKPLNKVVLFNSIHRVLSRNQLSEAIIGDVSPKADDFDHNIVTTAIMSPPAVIAKKRILIAEDVAYNRNLLTAMLESIGYSNIDSVEDGKQAFAKMESHVYDILILDLRMPVMDGYDVIEEMIKRQWKLPKVIVITASIMEDDKNRCKKLGIRYFVNKPVEIQQLKSVLLHVANKELCDQLFS